AEGGQRSGQQRRDGRHQKEGGKEFVNRACDGSDPKRGGLLDRRTERLEGSCQNAVVCRTIGRGLGGAPYHPRAKAWRCVRPQLAGRAWRFGRDARDECQQIAIVEWWLTCQQIVEGRSNRIDVRAHI